jgi:hypothetical protein
MGVLPDGTAFINLRDANGSVIWSAPCARWGDLGARATDRTRWVRSKGMQYPTGLARAAWAEPVEVQTVAADLVAGLGGNLGDGGI